MLITFATFNYTAMQKNILSITTKCITACYGIKQVYRYQKPILGKAIQKCTIIIT